MSDALSVTRPLRAPGVATGTPRCLFIGDRTDGASRASNRREWPPTDNYFSFGLVCMMVSGRQGLKIRYSNPEVGKVGTFAIVPAGQAHFVWTLDEEAIVQLQFEGPSKTIFVDPANEPQQK